MSRLLAIFLKDLRLILADRGELVALFLMPLAFILPVGLALGRGDGYGIRPDDEKQALPVANYDQGPGAASLLDQLGKSYTLEISYNAGQLEEAGLEQDPACLEMTAACVEKTARMLLARGQRGAALVLPDGFSEALSAGQKTSLSLLFDPAGDAARRQMVQGVVEGAALKLTLVRQVQGASDSLMLLPQFASPELRQDLARPPGTAAVEDQPPAITFKEVRPSNVSELRVADTYQQTVPGYTVMYVFFLIGTISSSIMDEKRGGTFRRLLGTPVRRWELLGGKLLAVSLVGLLQVGLLFGVGVLVFHMDLGGNWAGLGLLSLALVLTAVAIGLAAATLRSGGGLLLAPLIIAALLGGCMFPLDLMPPFLRQVSYFVPHSWALSGYQDLMVRGLGLAAVFPKIGVLLLFAGVFFALALWRFDFEVD